MDTTNSNSQSQLPFLFSLDFVKMLLRGAGQVMFQNNIWTGLLFLCGIFWGAYAEGSGLVAWGALVGLFTSTFTGCILGLPAEDGKSGLWGFNGILVGCAFPTFLGSTVFMWIGLILCSMLSTILRTAFNNIMAAWKINSLTFPFVFSSWVFFLAARLMHGIPTEGMATPGLINDFSTSIDLGFGHLIVYWLKGISRVFLIDSWVTGIFFLAALLVNNRWSAMWAAVASALSLFVILIFKGPGADIANGLYGFSAVLTGIALGSTFYKVNPRTAIWTLIGIVITVFVQAGMNSLFEPLGLPTFTGPFCVATWLFLLPLFKFDSANPDHSIWHKIKKEP